MIIQGRELMLFKRSGEDPSYTWTAMGSATNHTLNASRETIDISSKDTGIFGDSLTGVMSWSISVESLMEMADYESLMDAFLAGEKLYVAFAIASNANAVTGKPSGGWTIQENSGYEGEVIITQLDASTPHNDKATYTATLTGCGPLQKRNKE